MTSPFQYLNQAKVEDNPVYRAPDDAIESWKNLAEQVRTELTRMGFAASVVPNGDPFGLPPGAHVWVHSIQPFGVTLDWVPPVTNSPAYDQKVLAQDTSGLFSYVTTASKITLQAMHAILLEAGFEAQIDDAEDRVRYFRVLAAPTHPM
ncbi:hypothetical protein [Amycolatopsis sp. NPDC057786]|uniref:hypothetical protein n=1 Tax=Amycolatopsis sp. NPDC057786 TaxID=3346250 RepID=UPI00366C76C0